MWDSGVQCWLIPLYTSHGGNTTSECEKSMVEPAIVVAFTPLRAIHRSGIYIGKYGNRVDIFQVEMVEIIDFIIFIMKHVAKSSKH